MKKDFCRILGVSTSSFFYICSRSLLINTRLFFISHFVSVPLRRGYRGSRITVFVCSFVPVSFCIFDYLYRDFWFFVDCFVTSALSRSSHLEVFVKKVFLEISENSQENTCVRVSFLVKLQTFMRPATLLKKRLWHRCFPVNFAKFIKTRFLTEHRRWLLLTIAL